MPTGFVRIDRALSKDEAEQIRQRFQITVRPKPAPASDEQQLAEQQRTKAATDRANYCRDRGWLDCTCVAIYSRCYYGH